MWLFSAKLRWFLLPNQVVVLHKPTKQWVYDKIMSWCFKNTDIRHYKCRREIFVFLILRWTSRLKCESSAYLTDDVAQWPDHLRSDTQHLVCFRPNWTEKDQQPLVQTLTHTKSFSLFLLVSVYSATALYRRDSYTHIQASRTSLKTLEITVFLHLAVIPSSSPLSLRTVWWIRDRTDLRHMIDRKSLLLMEMENHTWNHYLQHGFLTSADEGVK